MQTGTKISALAHGLLLSWAVLGGAFRSDPLPFEVQDVTVISAEDFALMTGHSRTPEVVAAPSEPAQPEAAEAPEMQAASDAPPARSRPEVTPEPAPEALPETLPDPVPPAPQAQPEPEPAPPPQTETAALVPETPSPPQRPSDRIAPEPVAPPPPDARPDPVEREQVAPDAAAETPREAQQATAPEEAATEIVTEAEQTAALAPTRSPRPAVRPNRPAAAPRPERPAPAAEDAVAAALAEALGGTRDQTPAAPAVPSGPPLSAGEKEALRVAVSSCWNVGSLSSEALATTVVVAVSLSQDGKPQVDTIRMVSSSGGDDGAARQAFEAARRAIIRCGAKGYDLPADKYDRWRDIEMTFNPERMRIK